MAEEEDAELYGRPFNEIKDLVRNSIHTTGIYNNFPSNTEHLPCHDQNEISLSSGSKCFTNTT